LTILSIYTVFSNKVRPNLATIVAPFNGTVKSFDLTLLKRALADLSIGLIRLREPSLLLIEKASPNSSKSTWGASIDALAFFYHPTSFLHFVKYSLNVPGGWKILL
jgi:hypothetical protein